MSTLYRIGNEETILITTGAPDVLFRLCQHQQTDHGWSRLDQPLLGKRKLKSTRGRAAHGGGSGKPAADGQTELTHQDLQHGVILFGIAG